MKKVLTVTMDGIRYHASRPAEWHPAGLAQL